MSTFVLERPARAIHDRTMYQFGVTWDVKETLIRHGDSTYTDMSVFLNDRFPNTPEHEIACLIKLPSGSWAPLQATMHRWHIDWLHETLQQSERDTRVDPALVSIERFRRVDEGPCGYEFLLIFEGSMKLWLHHLYVVNNTNWLETLHRRYSWNHKQMATMYMEDLDTQGFAEHALASLCRNEQVDRQTTKRKLCMSQKRITSFVSACLTIS